MSPPPANHASGPGDAPQLVAAPDDLPRKGDWFRTKPATSAIRCLEYTAAPPPAGMGGIRVATIRPDVYVGPVHKSTDKGRIDGCTLFSVLVPSQHDPALLVWVNVKRERTWFASKVPLHVLQRWGDRGWVNMYQPMPTSSSSREGPT
jgi:hypothetical protein